MQSGSLLLGLRLGLKQPRSSPISLCCTSVPTHFLLKSSSSSPPMPLTNRAPPRSSRSTARTFVSDFLPELPFSGKTQHYKSKYAISAAAMIHGGVYPDLLDDAGWWEADDLWTYSFYALLIYVRAAADRTGRTGRSHRPSRWLIVWSDVDHLNWLTGNIQPEEASRAAPYPPATKATTT